MLNKDSLPKSLSFDFQPAVSSFVLPSLANPNNGCSTSSNITTPATIDSILKSNQPDGTTIIQDGTKSTIWPYAKSLYEKLCNYSSLNLNQNLSLTNQNDLLKIEDYYRHHPSFFLPSFSNHQNLLKNYKLEDHQSKELVGTGAEHLNNSIMNDQPQPISLDSKLEKSPPLSNFSIQALI